MTHHNPATILHDLLLRGRNEKKDQPCYVVWNRLLEVEVNGGLIAKLSEVMDLPRQINALVGVHFPHQTGTTAGWAPYVDNGFMNQQLGGQWSTFIDQIPNHCLPSLALTAELLNTKFVTNDISQEELKRLIDLLSAYVAEVDSTDLPPEIKAYLARELNELQHRLRAYAITGSLPILRQVEAMVGHCVVDQKYHAFLTSHELGKRLLDSLNAMAAVVTVSVGLPQLTQSIGQLLLK